MSIEGLLHYYDCFDEAEENGLVLNTLGNPRHECRGWYIAKGDDRKWYADNSKGQRRGGYKTLKAAKAAIEAGYATR